MVDDNISPTKSSKHGNANHDNNGKFGKDCHCNGKNQQETETILTETGIFKRIYHRIGKKRQVHTERTKKNPKKVVLARIEDLELYVLPYEFPDKIFLGKYPEFTMMLDKYSIPKLMVFYNKARWYAKKEWQNKLHFTKEAQKGSALLVKAFNMGLKQLKELDK